MFKHLYLLLTLLVAQVGVHAQETESTAKPRSGKQISERIVIGIGASYSIMELESTPFTLMDSTGTLGHISIKNKAGVNASVHYKIPLHERFSLRLGVEAHFLRPTLEYDQQMRNKKHSDIFPLEIEIPVVAQFALGSKTNDEGDNRSPYIVAGVRPAIPLKQFMSIYPTTKSYNIHADFGVGIPLTSKQYGMKLEAVYSLGLINLIGKNDQDFHTTSIQTLKRSFVGLRLYFS
jgi:hypothetical protein